MTEKDGAQPGSRERMLEAAIGLMRRSGLGGAGINEIVRASGAPKGSVYHFFPQGKLQIIAEALAVHSERVMAFIDRALAGESQPGDKVRALFAAFARRVEEGGFARSCAVGTVSLDLDDEVQALQPLLAARFADWMTLIAGHFDFADAARRQSFAGLLLTAIEGAYVRSRAERSPLAFVQAGAWLAELAEQAGSAAAAG